MLPFREDVYALADSIAILNDGKVEVSGNLEQILNLPHSSYSFLSQVTSGANYLSGEVVKNENGLTVFKTGEHLLYTLGEFPVGSNIGVIIRREDIILAKEKIMTSARNMLYVQVVNLQETLNFVDVSLRTEGLELVSRITKSATKDLGLALHNHIYAIFKASAPHLIREEN